MSQTTNPSPLAPHSPLSPGRSPQAEARLLELYAERQALSILRGANFTQCLTIHRIPPDLEVVDPRGNTRIIHGKDLFDERTWHKFLASLPHPLNLLSLTQSAELLVKLYRTWLLITYTQRYRWLTTLHSYTGLNRSRRWSSFANSWKPSIMPIRINKKMPLPIPGLRWKWGC